MSGFFKGIYEFDESINKLTVGCAVDFVTVALAATKKRAREPEVASDPVTGDSLSERIESLRDVIEQDAEKSFKRYMWDMIRLGKNTTTMMNLMKELARTAATAGDIQTEGDLQELLLRRDAILGLMHTDCDSKAFN